MIAAIIQARLGSTRLPNKVMEKICGKPMIWHIVNRLRNSKRIEKIILATTLNPIDDVIEGWAAENEITLFRGSENNVLNRYYEAASRHKIDIIVRITADDPFKDSSLIDAVIELLIKKGLDFAYNNCPPTFPEGMDVEVFRYEALQIAEKETHDAFEREHVTQYFFRNKERFKQENYKNEVNLSHLRWTVDTNEDLVLTRLIYNELFPQNETFGFLETMQYIKNNPDVVMINSSVKRSTMYL